MEKQKTILECIRESRNLNEANTQYGRNYLVTVKLSVPTNMNNAEVEDKVEEVLNKAGLSVLDIDVARK